MIWKYGELVARIISLLENDEAMWRDLQADLDGEEPIRVLVPRPGLESATLGALDHVRRLAILTEWDGLDPQITRISQRLLVLSAGEVGAALRALRERIEDDLKVEHFFHLTPSDVPLYESKEPFGAQVAKKFPKASEDIEEASKCLVFQRPTACVFHLMRAMEVIVQRLAKKLGVANVEKEWGKLLSDIAKAIEAMPKGAKRDRWSEAHTHLYHVKQAWRNDTMHPKQTYTREQAHDVYRAVRIFAAHLAGLV